MFAVFKALDRMNELAEFAQTRTGQNMSFLLERRFQAWVTELKDFVAEQEFEDLTLLSARSLRPSPEPPLTRLTWPWVWRSKTSTPA